MQLLERRWDLRAAAKAERLSSIGFALRGKTLDATRMVEVLESLIRPGDRVCIEGNNQKQADFLSRSLASADPERLHDLHLLLSVLGRPEHIDLFERGIARKVDFSFSGPQSLRLAQLVADGRVEIGAIHTYLELFGRYFVDLTPDISLVAADAADADGNLYTGANTEETPTIVEATAFRNGVVIAQVNEIVSTLPRVDIPRLVGRRDRRARYAIRDRALIHARPGGNRRRSDPHGDARNSRRVRTASRSPAQPRNRVRHGRDRIDSSDVC
jgi:malonate decarboxylase alpha subunit